TAASSNSSSAEVQVGSLAHLQPAGTYGYRPTVRVSSLGISNQAGSGKYNRSVGMRGRQRNTAAFATISRWVDENIRRGIKANSTKSRIGNIYRPTVAHHVAGTRRDQSVDPGSGLVAEYVESCFRAGRQVYRSAIANSDAVGNQVAVDGDPALN